MFDGLIEYESRWVGGNFKKNAIRLTEIDGMEIGPIKHGCYVQWHFRKHLAPLKLCVVTWRSEGDVMNASGTHVSIDTPRLNEDVDVVPWSGSGGDIPNAIVLLTCPCETHLL